MKRVMLVALAILLVGASAFAVDFTASVRMDGDLWANDHGFKLANQGQTDADLLQFSVSTDNAGASVAFWSPQNTKDVDGGIVNMRYEKLWFKPVSQVKILLGHIGTGLYTEQLNWWMVPTGAADGGAWGSDAGAAGKGFTVDITPVAGLTIDLGIATGQYGNLWMAPNLSGTPVITSDTRAGATAKYNIAGFGSVGAAYRFNGGSVAADGSIQLNDQEIRLGADVNAVPGLYAFVTGIVRMENTATTGYTYGMGAFVIDNYFAYSVAGFTVKGEFPVTLRLSGNATDHSYLSYDLKASYKVADNFSPFLRVMQNGGINLVDKKTLAEVNSYNRSIDFSAAIIDPQIRLGADWSVGKASFTTWVQINLPANDAGETHAVTWAIPFQCRVSW